MKRFLQVIGCLLVLASVSYGQQLGWTQSGIVVASGAVAQGRMYQNSNVLRHTLIWTVTATVSACTVQFETSANGTSWSLMTGSVAQTCTSTGTYTFAGTAAKYVRVNFTAMTISGGGALAWSYGGNVVPQATGTVVNCATSAACSATNVNNLKIVFGNAPFSSASPSTLAVTGMPSFTSSSSYQCNATPVGGTAAIAAGGVAAANQSATAVTFTGPNTVTTTVNWICYGT